MRGYIDNIERATLDNNNFRKVIYTTKLSQLVVMTLEPGEDIGAEVHEDHDQFIRIESGKGKAVFDGVEHQVEDDFALVIPAGMEHNVINTGDTPLKLYTIYTPPEHREGVVHVTKDEAEADDEHFDGTTTE